MPSTAVSTFILFYYALSRETEHICTIKPRQTQTKTTPVIGLIKCQWKTVKNFFFLNVNVF